MGSLRTRPSSPPFVLHLQPRGSPRRLYSVQPVLQLLLHQVNSWRWDRLRWRERPNAKWGPRSTITVKTGRGDVMLYHAGNLCMLNSKEAWTYDKLEGESRHEMSCLSIGFYAPKTAQNSTCAIVVCIVINPMWRSVIPIKNNSVIPINLKNYSVPLKRHTCWLGWLDVRSSDIFKIYSFPQVTSLTFVYLNKC